MAVSVSVSMKVLFGVVPEVTSPALCDQQQWCAAARSPSACRLEQLLAMGSLVVREESGFRAFYHHLLQPGVHYVSFWKRVGQACCCCHSGCLSAQ